jgi:hypothetical protein
MEVSLAVNVERAKDMLVSLLQNGSQNQDIKIANRKFENVSQFKYFRMTVTTTILFKRKLRGD